MTTAFVKDCWSKVHAWAEADALVAKALFVGQITKLFQGYEAAKVGLQDLKKALVAKDSELQMVREVLHADIKTGADRNLYLEVENQRLMRWKERVSRELREHAEDWRRSAAAVDHPMRLQSPSWPIQCAVEVEATLDDAESDLK